MKKLLFFILIIAINFITACSADEGSAPQGIQSYFYVINMTNFSDTDVHMFVSSEGEAFGEGNKVKPQDTRTYKKLIEKPFEHEFTVSVGRNGVVMGSRNAKLTYSDYSLSVFVDENNQLGWSK